MSDTRGRLTRALSSALAELGAEGIEPAFEESSRPEFGDFSSPAALRTAKILRRAPMQIAEELADRLRSADLAEVSDWVVTAPGYLNARLDPDHWAHAVLAAAEALDPATAVEPPLGFETLAGKTLIEHTNINTNKAAHIGHLRNACIGDTVARLLRRTGQQVEVNNYIDDTGVQVADVVVGIRSLGVEQQRDEPFDQFCSRVYVEVCRRYEDAPELREQRRDVLHAIELGGNETADYVKQLSRRIVAAHLQTMARFGVGYDVLTWESDILRLGFWEHAFTLLQQRDVIHKVTEGKNAGCWVLPAEDNPDLNSPEAKVLVKSDGIATYTAKDIAYQLWKFGLLDRDFGYGPWDDGAGAPWTTTSDPSQTPPRRFGHADRVINVIDARQSYLQAIVRRALHQIGFPDQSAQSVHLAYEVVALSPSAAEALGIEVEPGRQMYALSGRKGIEVRADDLLDRAVVQVREKAQDESVARQLAAGAIRFYLLRFSLNQLIAFDFEEALRTTGDTGVYLQYAHARAAGILRRVPEETTAWSITELLPCERALLHRIDSYATALHDAAGQLAPHVLCAYALALGSALSDVYEHTPAVVREQDPAVRSFRRALISATRSVLADCLTTLGIGAPDRI